MFPSLPNPLLLLLTLGASENYSDESTSVNPEFRTARCSLACGSTWAYDKDNGNVAVAMGEFGEKFYEYGSGVYFNEPDYFLQNWKVCI